MDVVSIWDIFSWMSGIAYALYAFPQVLYVIQKGNAESLSLGFIFLALFGGIFSFIYSLSLESFPLTTNFLFTILTSLIWLKYKLYPRKAK